MCGVHRSGSSLLHSLVRSHPQISGLENSGVPQDEGQHLQSVLPKNASSGVFAFHKESFMDEAHPLSTKEIEENSLNNGENTGTWIGNI